jgi:hypothetical protein
MTKKIGSTLCTVLIFLLWILAFSGGGTTQVSGTSNDITRFPIGVEYTRWHTKRHNVLYHNAKSKWR